MKVSNRVTSVPFKTALTASHTNQVRFKSAGPSILSSPSEFVAWFVIIALADLIAGLLLNAISKQNKPEQTTLAALPRTMLSNPYPQNLYVNPFIQTSGYAPYYPYRNAWQGY